MHDAAVRLMKHVKYENAATVEFLVQDDDFYFIEVNPRIQVEHTVTEEILGIDLVQMQIRIAQGAFLADLGLGNDCVLEARGTAIQCRVTCEMPWMDDDVLSTKLKEPTEDPTSQKLISFFAESLVNGTQIQGQIGKPASLQEIEWPRLKHHKLQRHIRNDLHFLEGWRKILQTEGPKGFASQVRKHPRVLLTDTTWRDAQQSLLATRIRTIDFANIAPDTNLAYGKAYSLECWGGATFDVALRFLHEDPWKRLVPDVPFQMLLRSVSGLAYSAGDETSSGKAIGTGVATMLACVDAGADIIDGATDSMSGTTSQPAMSALISSLMGKKEEPEVYIDDVCAIDSYWAQLRLLYAGFDAKLSGTDPDVYLHEIPARELGLSSQWKETKAAFVAANYLLGDIIKATPTSKAVADLAQFMVNSELGYDDVLARADSLDFPDSVIDFFVGLMGQPFDGFPEPLRTRVLIRAGRAKMNGQASSQLVEVVLESVRQQLTDKYGDTITETDICSHIMFPDVFAQYRGYLARFGDVSLLPTRQVLVPPKVGEEMACPISEGRIVRVQLLAVQPLVEGADVSPERTVFFRINGQYRQATVYDLAEVLALAPFALVKYSYLRNHHDESRHVSESSPLLQSSTQAALDASVHSDPSHSIPRALKRRTVVLLCVFAFTMMLGDNLQPAALIQIFEDSICNDYYSTHPWTPVSNTMAAPNAPLADRCKAQAVQKELALVRGFQQLVPIFAALLCTVPYGLLAERIGRRRILILSGAGVFASLSWVLAVCYWRFVSIRWVWLSGIFLFIGGGDAVTSSAVHVMVTDVTDSAERAQIFLYLHAADVISGFFGPAISVHSGNLELAKEIFWQPTSNVRAYVSANCRLRFKALAVPKLPQDLDIYRCWSF
ncbi:hypothetical protein G7Z17_g622 [Cylindrodendrum hubeiense]|uniref:ATP-grasp domain-containing protein n=1 Tax=Cylindrodendrum hubeiense TaxID=595255 RepID=A0A9P5HHI7_9HYPO|nr:hypothetical protein G7Z17_g622 [Cylindrodendrum hubeiense]